MAAFQRYNPLAENVPDNLHAPPEWFVIYIALAAETRPSFALLTLCLFGDAPSLIPAACLVLKLSVKQEGSPSQIGLRRRGRIALSVGKALFQLKEAVVSCPANLSRFSRC